MKIGMSGASIMLAPWDDGIRAAAELGYQAFEIFGEFPQLDFGRATRQQRSAVRKQAEECGIEITLHAPFNDLNIASMNRGIMEESIRQTIEAAKFCRDLGGRTVVVHSGKFLVDAAEYGASQARAVQWQLNLDALKRVCEAAAKLGVTMCLENCNFDRRHIDQNLDDLLRIRKEVDNPYLKFTLDIGHSRLAEGVETALKKLGREIHHVHFTDNLGRNDDHLVIGEGNFDYAPLRKFIKSFPRVVVLEVIEVGISIEPAQKSLANFRKIMGLETACLRNA